MTLIDTYSPTAARNATSPISPNGKSAQSSSLVSSVADFKLRKAAAQFEGMLLSSLWKSMKSTFAAPEEESGDPAHDTLDDLSIQTMSDAVGKAGGLGLGKLILKHLEPMIANSQSQTAAHAGKDSVRQADIPW
jgi:Rod binding domain-containing protein